MCSTVNYNNGTDSCKIALVFSCPGQDEENSGKLVSGKTGRNLDKLLSILHEENSDIFHSINRYDYRITNASNIVHYKGLDNRTEPLDNEIKQELNLKRLHCEIYQYEYVITFGKKANMAVKLCKKLHKDTYTHIQCKYHLGYQGINHIDKDFLHGVQLIKGNKDNTEKRLKVIALDIIQQLKCIKFNF